jgi:hypothetical protein
MSTRLNLKEIERKAFCSTFQDGLRDIQLGLIVLGMSFLVYRCSILFSRQAASQLLGRKRLLADGQPSITWPGRRLVMGLGCTHNEGRLPCPRK